VTYSRQGGNIPDELDDKTSNGARFTFVDDYFVVSFF
jgi:hypothetical protein